MLPTLIISASAALTLYCGIRLIGSILKLAYLLVVLTAEVTYLLLKGVGLLILWLLFVPLKCLFGSRTPNEWPPV